jgi:hypothetical protein
MFDLQTQFYKHNLGRSFIFFRAFGVLMKLSTLCPKHNFRQFPKEFSEHFAIHKNRHKFRRIRFVGLD